MIQEEIQARRKIVLNMIVEWKYIKHHRKNKSNLTI